MTAARKEIVTNEESTYHCVSRCVRRAYLCGFDALSGRNYDHRKDWLRARIEYLSKIFTIDMLAYALMSTHQHLLLRTRPDILETLRDEEVAQRWLLLYPIKDEINLDSTDRAIQNLVRNKNRIKELRERLGCISWYMKSVNEFIARKANKEDDCKGRFWEGRFKTQRLDGDNAILVCAIYIDLNPIRARVATKPENSKYTSAYERINSICTKDECNSWLAPIKDLGHRKGFLDMDLSTYLTILDETGRMLVEGKRGKISRKLAPILERLGIKSENWNITIQHFGKWFSSIAGQYEIMQKAAQALNKNWLKGMRSAKLAFN